MKLAAAPHTMTATLHSAVQTVMISVRLPLSAQRAIGIPMTE